MTVSEKGRAFIKKQEGIAPHPYRDVAGHLTIGVGHRLTQSELMSGYVDIRGDRVRWHQGLSQPKVDALLEQDLGRFEASVSLYTEVALEQHEFDALVSFAFNVGVVAYRKSTLLRRLNAGDREAIRDELYRWRYAAGRVVAGLAIRRQREAALFERGDYGGVVPGDDGPYRRDTPPLLDLIVLEPLPPTPLPFTLPETHREALSRFTPAQVSAVREVQHGLLRDITKPHSTLWDKVRESEEFDVAVEGAKVVAGAAIGIAFEMLVGAIVQAAGLELED